jgi:hypothetical protein
MTKFSRTWKPAERRQNAGDATARYQSGGEQLL